MKRTWGGILLTIGIVATIYTTMIGVFLLSIVSGIILGAGIALLSARDFVIEKNEVREEEGVFRLYITVQNNQKRATRLSFVANVFHNGVSVGVVTSNSILLNGLGTGSLMAVLPRPNMEMKKEEITWEIVKWYFK